MRKILTLPHLRKIGGLTISEYLDYYDSNQQFNPPIW
jgi:hypothetical protein